MVNVYTDYVKELYDYIYGLFEVSPNETGVRLEYRFSDYHPAKVAQQQNLLDVMQKAGVLKILSHIDLPPMKQIEMSMHGNEYSAARCAGYVFEVDKDAFMSHRASTKLIRALNDEHEYNMPHVSSDGRTLFIENKEISLSKNDTPTKNVQLVSLIFSSDDYCCTEESFAQTAGGGKALENPSAYAKNAVDYLNDIIQKKTRVENFLRRENGLISLNPKYLD